MFKYNSLNVTIKIIYLVPMTALFTDKHVHTYITLNVSIVFMNVSLFIMQKPFVKISLPIVQGHTWLLTHWFLTSGRNLLHFLVWSIRSLNSFTVTGSDHCTRALHNCFPSPPQFIMSNQQLHTVTYEPVEERR